MVPDWLILKIFDSLRNEGLNPSDFHFEMNQSDEKFSTWIQLKYMWAPFHFCMEVFPNKISTNTADPQHTDHIIQAKAGDIDSWICQGNFKPGFSAQNQNFHQKSFQESLDLLLKWAKSLNDQVTIHNRLRKEVSISKEVREMETKLREQFEDLKEQTSFTRTEFLDFKEKTELIFEQIIGKIRDLEKKDGDLQYLVDLVNERCNLVLDELQAGRKTPLDMVVLLNREIYEVFKNEAKKEVCDLFGRFWVGKIPWIGLHLLPPETYKGLPEPQGEKESK